MLPGRDQRKCHFFYFIVILVVVVVVLRRRRRQGMKCVHFPEAMPRPRSSMRERGSTSPRSSVVIVVLHSLLSPVVVVVVVGRRRRRRQPYIDENQCIPRVSVLKAGPLA